jgi:hypothetical protein
MRIALCAVAALLLVPGAVAKDFKPGDLRICNASRCVKIVDRHVLPTIGAFYYRGGTPQRAQTPPLGAQAFELRFVNGYATGIVAGPKLDRFLSYGVNLERFRRGAWYRVPPRFAAELRRLACGLRPLRVTKAALAKSH